MVIALVGTVSRLLEPIAPRETRTAGRVCLEDKVEEFHDVSMIDDPKVEFASTACVVSAEPGRPVLVLIAFPHHAGLGSMAVRLTPRLPARAPAKADLGEGDFLIDHECSYLIAPELMPCLHFEQKDLHYLFNLFRSDNSDESTEEDFFADLGPEGFLQEPDSVMEMMDHFHDLLLAVADEEREETGSQESRYYRMDNHLLIRSGEKRLQKVTEQQKSLLAGTAGTVNVDVRFVQVQGGPEEVSAQAVLAAGDSVGRTTLPMMRGSRAVSIAGFEGVLICDYDVDVATRAAVPNPHVGCYLDGARICLQHEPRPGRPDLPGRVKCWISLNRLKDAHSRELSGRARIFGKLDTPCFDQAYLCERFAVDGKPHILGTLTTMRDGKVSTLYAVGQARADG
jgi:hypothetical protein